MGINEETLALAAVWYVAFLLSLTCHEAAHALAAKIGGDPTAYEAGQVTLNPLPHIRRSPFGTVLVPLVTFYLSHFMMGWASAPYDPRWQERHPRRAALMAIAGPAANFLLVALSIVVIRVGIAVRFFSAPQQISFSHMVAPGAPGAAEGLATGAAARWRERYRPDHERKGRASLRRARPRPDVLLRRADSRLAPV
jgi:hypothetical protein